MEMTMEKREKLLKAGFFPVDADFWLYDGFPFLSEADRRKHTWARRNRYTGKVMPYSEAYLAEHDAEYTIQKAFMHEKEDAVIDISPIEVCILGPLCATQIDEAAQRVRKMLMI